MTRGTPMSDHGTRRRRACRPGFRPVPLLALLALTGCGYSTGQLYRPGIETVHVEIFDSKEFRRDLEFALTEAVKKRIGMETPYRLASREQADTILKGEILEERQAAFAPDWKSREPREKQLALGVRIEWKDVRTGRVLVDKPVLLEAVDYLPPTNELKYFPATGETEKFAQDKVIDKLAARIVAEMYDDW
jgi:hypothetical protein